MTPTDLRERITAQFSYQGDQADVWRGFDLVLDTDAFLNMGYSPWYLPTFVGSSQLRLAAKIGERLSALLPTTDDVSLLDVGCGRGGPAVHLATQFGFDVTGVDLVPYNVARATANARDQGVDAQFVVGDATALPFAAESMTACTSIDALVYVPDRVDAVSELAAVLEPGGVVVCSDLVRRSTISERDRETVGAFADAWDMPPLGSVREYRRLFVDAGLKVRTTETITSHSVGRFRKWTTLFLGLLASPARPLVVRSLRWYGLDPSAVITQVQRAHEALPHLEHIIIAAER